MHELTTLELAERIATAARRADGLGAAVSAVLETLRVNEAWFCRLIDDGTGEREVGHRYEQRSLLPKVERDDPR